MRDAGLFAAICCLNFQSAEATADTSPLTNTASRLRASTEQQLPSCAQTCLERILPQQDCTVDSSCYCEDKLAASLEKCVASLCELPDYLAGQKSYAVTCDRPIRNKGPATRILNWAMFGVATIFIAGRFLGRQRSLGGSGYGWDDCEWNSTVPELGPYLTFYTGLALVAYVFLITTDVTSELEVQNGLGMDMYLISIAQIVELMKVCHYAQVKVNCVLIRRTGFLLRRNLLQRDYRSNKNLARTSLLENLACRLRYAKLPTYMLGAGRCTLRISDLWNICSGFSMYSSQSSRSLTELSPKTNIPCRSTTSGSK